MGLMPRPTMAVPMTSTTSLARVSLVNGNSTPCVVRRNNITDQGAYPLENLDADLLKAHERPLTNPSNHDYVSPYVA